jgi:uncharacterized protein (DUF2384 family)
VHDQGVPLRDEVLHRAARGVEVVHVDEARRHPRISSRRRKGKLRRLSSKKCERVGRGVEHRGGDQAVDVLRLEQLHRAPLGVVVALGAGHEERVAGLVGLGAPRP